MKKVLLILPLLMSCTTTKDCAEVLRARLAQCQPVNEEVASNRNDATKEIRVITAICPAEMSVKVDAIFPSDEDKIDAALKQGGFREAGECKHNGHKMKILELDTPMQQARYLMGE